MNEKLSTETLRRNDLDWLRAAGAILVVLAHCATTFSPWSAAAIPDATFTYIETSKLFSQFLLILDLWLMPLFMLLAGAGAWYALRKRTNRQYLSERFRYLGIPFAILFPFFVVPSMYLAQFYSGTFHGSFVDFILHYFHGIMPNGNFAFAHLWFLVYLLIYVAVSLPLFRFLQCDAGRKLTDLLARACRSYGGIYLFALPMWAVHLALSGIWPQPPFPALVNDVTRFGFLLLVFISGYILLSDRRFDDAIARQWPLAAVAAFGTSAILMQETWPDNFNPYRDLPVDYSWHYYWFWTVFTVSSWSWLVALLGASRRFLNSAHPVEKYLCGASFPIYLLHPILWIPGVVLVSAWKGPAIVGFVALSLLVLPGTLALVALLNRSSRLYALIRRPRQHIAPSLHRLPMGDLIATLAGHSRP